MPLNSVTEPEVLKCGAIKWIPVAGISNGPVTDKAQLGSCTDRCTAILKAKEEKAERKKRGQIGRPSGE